MHLDEQFTTAFVYMQVDKNYVMSIVTFCKQVD